MGRKSRKLVLKIRYTRGSKPNKGFGTSFICSNNHKNARCGKGRVLQVRKVSREEAWKVGEYIAGAFQFDERLPASLLKK